MKPEDKLRKVEEQLNTLLLTLTIMKDGVVKNGQREKLSDWVAYWKGQEHAFDNVVSMVESIIEDFP